MTRSRRSSPHDDRPRDVRSDDDAQLSPEPFTSDLTVTSTTTASSYESEPAFIGRSGEMPADIRSSAAAPPPAVWPSTTRTSTTADWHTMEPHRVEIGPALPMGGPALSMGRGGGAEVDGRVETRPARPSTGALIADVASDLSTLVRQEAKLARAEMRQSASRAGKGTGMFGAAAGAGLFSLLFVLLAAMFGLSTVMAPGWAALIVGALLLVSAAAVGLVGRAQVRKVHAKPTQTVETLKEDMQWAHGLRK